MLNRDLSRQDHLPFYVPKWVRSISLLHSEVRCLSRGKVFTRL